MKNAEGKDIGRSTLGGDSKKKAQLEPGQQLQMMGKDIEVFYIKLDLS